MKRIIFATASAVLFATLQSASAATPRVVHYLNCGESDAPMFDAIVVNLEHHYRPRSSQLIASVYHRVEQATNLITRVNVRERQARRPGAPKEFLGEGFYLEVQTTVPPSHKGLPGKLDLRSDNLSIKTEMNCRFSR